MKLAFLGQSYEAAIAPIDAIATTETATFLGQQYTRKQFTVTLRQPTAELTYRGVRYSR